MRVGRRVRIHIDGDVVVPYISLLSPMAKSPMHNFGKE